MPYRNALLIAFLLPVPDGYAGMIRVASPTHRHDTLGDLKTMADFVCLAYQGTLAQWREYLANPAWLPDAIKDLALHFDYGKALDYQSRRLDFAYTPALQAIDKDSQLTLGLSYFQDHGKVVWDVSRIAAKANASDADGIDIIRHAAPSSDLDDDYRGKWNKLLHHSPPYDGVPYSKDDVTAISTVSSAPIAADGKPGVLYRISYAAEGQHPGEAMQGKLKLLLDKLRVNEP
jgi:hypothetical protein